MATRKGRPSSYTPKAGEELCRRIVEGETLRQICADEHMPDKSTVHRWLLNVADKTLDDFRDQYARAREAQMDHYADEIIEICDDGSNDWIQRESEKGRIETVCDHEHVNRSRLRVDTRKWLMSKIAAKRYGDKITQEHTGKDGSPLIPVLEIVKKTNG